uniref:Uncharacterized protein n=1 Tax=Rhodnius prolixus TaxID=13249 RepID=T1HLM6_RHOPR
MMKLDVYKCKYAAIFPTFLLKVHLLGCANLHGKRSGRKWNRAHYVARRR